MQIIKWEPWKEIDKYFNEDLFSPFQKLGGDLAVDLYEENGNIIVKMNMAGIAEDELDIGISGDMLTVSGSREEEKEIDKKNYFSKEIHRGTFSRSVQLPKSIDQSKAKATYKDGVLLVAIPVLTDAKNKKVQVPLVK